MERLSCTRNVSCVDVVYPGVERRIEASSRNLRLNSKAIGQPRAERDFGDLQVAMAQAMVMHGEPSSPVTRGSQQ